MKRLMQIMMIVIGMSVYTMAGWQEAAKIVRAGEDGIDPSFGYSIDVDGEYLAVGAPKDNKGAVYVFKKTADGDFEQIDKIESLSYYPSDFGSAVAIKKVGDDPFVLIGEPYANHLVGTPEGGIHPVFNSAVMIYHYDSEQEKFEQYGFAYFSEDNTGLGLGKSVDLSGYVEYSYVPGSPPQLKLEDYGLLLVAGEENYGEGDGRVLTYSHSLKTENDIWKESILYHEGSQNHFGHSVAISSDVYNFLVLNGRAKLVVGAPNEELSFSDTTYPEKGAVYVYELNATHSDGFHWAKEQRLSQFVGYVLRGNSITTKSHFGTSVDMASNRYDLIIGATKQNIVSDDLQGEAPGAAYIYHLTDVNSNTWERNITLRQTSNPSEESELFGASVSIDNNISVAVGAPAFKNSSQKITGAVFAYKLNDEQIWAPAGYYIGSGEGNVSASVKMTEDSILVGDPANNTVSILKESMFNPSIIMYLLN